MTPSQLGSVKTYPSQGGFNLQFWRTYAIHIPGMTNYSEKHGGNMQEK